MVIQSSRSRGHPVCSNLINRALQKIIVTILIITMVTKAIAIVIRSSDNQTEKPSMETQGLWVVSSQRLIRPDLKSTHSPWVSEDDWHANDFKKSDHNEKDLRQKLANGPTSSLKATINSEMHDNSSCTWPTVQSPLPTIAKIGLMRNNRVGEFDIVLIVTMIIMIIILLIIEVKIVIIVIVVIII